jgi:hypothetical protein
MDSLPCFEVVCLEEMCMKRNEVDADAGNVVKRTVWQGSFCLAF